MKDSWRIGHLGNLESPWGNAGGVVKRVEDVEKMAQTGVGWIEAGSYTVERREGNKKNAERDRTQEELEAEPVIDYWYDADAYETFNSLGMPNQGLDELVKEIPEMVRIAEAYGKKLVVNVAPVTSEPIEETLELVDRTMEAGAHKVMLNAGCPNVDGHIPLSRHPETLGRVLLGQARTVKKHNKKIGVRISPQNNYYEAGAVYRRAITSRTVDSIWTPNTWAVGEAMSPLRGVPGGGRSGAKWVPEARKQLEWAADILRGSQIDIVSSSSIMSGRELALRLNMGAVAGAGTTFYYESRNGWQDDTDQLLYEFADEQV
jgi:dihydroorotate dehydrogenase